MSRQLAERGEACLVRRLPPRARWLAGRGEIFTSTPSVYSSSLPWLERTACTAYRDVLPRRRRTEKRCTSSLSAGGRDAAGLVTNGERERERPPQPCVRYSEERQTRQAGSIVYSGAYYLFLHKNPFIFCVRAIERYNFI